MKKNALFACFWMLFSVVVVAQQPPTPNLLFNNFLTAEAAVPANASNGRGMISLLLNPTRTKMSISGLLTNLDGSVVGAGLHRGRAGEVGDLVLDLMPFLVGRKIEGEADVSAELLQLLLSDKIYCNIRTTAHPTGELRGQLHSESDLNFSIEYSSGQMVPPVNSAGWGLGNFHFPVGSDEILYSLGMQHPDDVIIGATLFEGKPGEIGTKVADFGVNPPFKIIFGVIEFDELPTDFLEKCIAGAYFLVIKTEKFPLGEVRGQVKFMGHLNSIFSVNGLNNVPPTNSTGLGLGLATCSEKLDSLHLTVLLNEIQPTAVQLRRGQPGQVGPVVGNLVPVSGQPGKFVGTFSMSNNDLTDLIANRFYVNVPTINFPTGEIRGPVQNNLRKCFAFDLCGSQVVPSNASTALGMGMLSIDQVDCYTHFRLILDGLSGTPTSGGIYNAPLGSNGIVLYNESIGNPTSEINHGIQAPFGKLFDNFDTYISIGTAAFPSGEVRGQVVRQLTCPLLSNVDEIAEKIEVNVLQNPARDQFSIKISSPTTFDAQLILQHSLGMAVGRQSVRLTEASQILNFEVGHLPSGVYFLQIFDAEKGKFLGKWQVAVVR